MKNKNYALGVGMIVAGMVGAIFAAHAAEQIDCDTKPTCEEMGYNKTEAQCEGKDTLRCPFDFDKVACPD